MTDEVFVDTNVLVYWRDASEPVKQARAREWLKHLWRTRTGHISVQILQEYYNTVTRKLPNALDRAAARSDVHQLVSWSPIVADPALLDAAMQAEDRYGFSWWDALVVAAAWRAGCRYLLTEDLQDGQDLCGLVVLDPFAHTPDTSGP